MPLMMELTKDLNSRELFFFPPLFICFKSVAMSLLLRHDKNGFGIQFFGNPNLMPKHGNQFFEIC